MDKEGKFQPTPEQLIEAILGAGAESSARRGASEILDSIKQRLVDIVTSGSSPAEAKKAGWEHLGIWTAFINNLVARTISTKELRDPKKVDTAIKGASALLSPDRTKKDKMAARKMVQALKEHYGKDILR